MLYTKDQQKEFEAFWKSYNLPPDTNAYWTLFDMWLGFRSGQYKTDIDILGDTTAYDCARLLKQLNEAIGGEFSLECGLKGGEKYKNPALLKMLQESLNTTLSAYVEKRKGVLILSKCYGGGDTGRAFIIDCPDSNPKEADFSDAELTAIVRFEESTQREVNKLQGRKVRNRDNSKNYDGAGKSAELGLEATIILEIIKGLHFIPKGEDVDKIIFRYNFVFEFMESAGLLDCRPDKQALLANGMKMRERYVKNWITAYKATKLEMHPQ